MLLISVVNFQVSSNQKLPDQGWVDMGQKSPMEYSVKVKASLTSWVIWQIWQEADGPFVLPVSFQLSPSHFSALKQRELQPWKTSCSGLTKWNSRLTKQGKSNKSTDGSVKFWGWSTDNAQIKEHICALFRLGLPCFKYYLLFCCHRSATFVIPLLFLG